MSMSTGTTHNPDLNASLSAMAQCPGFLGAVLATSDGLVLVNTLALEADTAAASASSILLDVQSAFVNIGQAQPQELLIWSRDKVWFALQLPGNYVILAACSDTQHAGALRVCVRAEMATLQLCLP